MLGGGEIEGSLVMYRILGDSYRKYVQLSDIYIIANDGSTQLPVYLEEMLLAARFC